MSLFSTDKIEEGAKCANCRRGAYKKVREIHEREGFGKTLFKGLMKGATKQSASEIGLGKAVYKCSKCGHEVTY